MRSWIFTAASVAGVIQSLIWMGLSLTAMFAYLNIIPAKEYKKPSDFFFVTLNIIYFDAPSNRSYLGPLKYPNIVLCSEPSLNMVIAMIYFILNAFYLPLSGVLFSGRKNPKKCTSLFWSCLTILISCVDLFYTIVLIFDVLYFNKFLCDHMVPSEKVLAQKVTSSLPLLPYIPLFLALFSSKFVFIWLWNVIIAASIFFHVMCCGNTNTVMVPPPQEEKKTELGNHNYSFEGVTSFNENFDKATSDKLSRRSYLKDIHEPTFSEKPIEEKNSEVFNPSKVEERDDLEADFEQSLRNFELGRSSNHS